jgi:hypothetical protein
MPTESGKPLIVISYAHADEPEHPAEGEVKWLSFVTGYLRPAIKHGAVDLWLDRLMSGGAEWEREIEQKLSACDIFILLVSRHSLSSDYVVDKEIAIVRERQAKGEAVHFYPLVLTPTPKIALDLVSDKNLRPRDGKPLSDYSINERYRHMSDAADEIAEIAAKITKPKAADRGPLQALSPLASSSPSASTTPIAITGRAGIFVSTTAEASQEQQPHITDEASLLLWLTDQSPEVAIAIASRIELRISPLVVHAAQGQPSPNVEHMVSQLTGAVFQVGALARVAAKYPERASDFVKAVGPAMSVAVAVAQTAGHSAAALGAIKAAIASATAISGEAKRSALSAVRAALDATVGLSAMPAVWAEIRADAVVARALGAGALVDLPLWSGSAPRWAEIAWGDVQALLPEGENWKVWIDWYQQRLGGGSGGEDYELIFASVPHEEWDKGPAAANAWIREHLPPSTIEPEIKDQKSLEAWLKAQTREVVVAIAARAALRAVPAISRSRGDIGNLTSAAFRAIALARIAAKYPTRANELRDAAGAAERVIKAAGGPGAAEAAIGAALADDAAEAAAYGAHAAGVAASEVNFAGYYAAHEAANRRTGPAVGAAAAVSFWAEISADAKAAGLLGASAVADLPLWSAKEPRWLDATWFALLSALPNGEDWEIWFDWYQGRLQGGSRGETYELVFATVPEEEWDKGPVAANAWIKAHLPKVPEDAQPADLPKPVADVESPWSMLCRRKGQSPSPPGPKVSRFTHTSTANRNTVRRCMPVESKRNGC